jgi:hypothetical protein
MNCAQRILYNGSNLVASAVLSPSSVLPAPKAIRTLPVLPSGVPALRDGSAGLELSGSFTGDGDSTFEIEIVDTTVSVPLVSRPLQTGVGSGDISAIAYTGAAQTFTVELVDAGSPESAASLAFRNVTLVARAVGVSGNAISISVADALTFTPLNFSLISPLPEGTEKSASEGLDWNSAVMSADDQIPIAAKRIVFGEDRTTVYRQWKQWTGKEWEYGFAPKLQRYVAKGERISEVSGGYNVTVTNGVTTEVYNGVVTDYDFLERVNSQSALIKVVGVIANDRASGGQASSEFDLKTKAYAKPTVASGSATANEVQLRSVVVNNNAATEIIEFRCFAVRASDSPNATLGNELWAVSGAVSGDVGIFSTGDTITEANGRWSAVIPEVYPDGYGATNRGEFTVRDISYATRTSSSLVPPKICVEALTLGPEAVDQSITLVYTKRPAAACDCEGMPFPDFTGDLCLFGPNNPAVGGGIVSSYPVTITARMTSLWAWYAELYKAYTDDHFLRSSTSPNQMEEKERIAAARTVCAQLEKTAIAVAAASAALTLWDDMFLDVKAHFGSESDGGASLIAAEAIAANRFVRVIAGRVYLAIGGGNLTLNLPGYSSECTGYTSVAIASGATVNMSDIQFPKNGYLVVAPTLTINSVYMISSVTPGTLAALTPAVNATGQMVGFNGTASATDLLTINASAIIADALGTGDRQPTRLFNVYIERFKSSSEAILASAGISPLGKPDASTVSDDGCWQNVEGEYYWSVTGSVGGGYMPAFTNNPYRSVREIAGVRKSTREFAFQINVGEECVSQLLAGDRIELSIGSAGWNATYQVGDRLYLPIIAQANQYLTGGAAGTSTQRWHVTGSVAGPLAPFVMPLAGGAYAASGLSFALTPGVIAFAKGDKFEFAIEGGHWRWRQGAGAWTTPQNIVAAPVLLANGVSAQFATGSAPSFVANDRYAFAARQPNASGNAKLPSSRAWRWDTSGATLDIDFGVASAFDSIAIVHDLPLSATVTVSAGSTLGGSDVLASTPLTVSSATLSLLLATSIAARYLRVTVANAAGASIAWVYAGLAFTPSSMAKFNDARQYVMDRAGGKNQAAQFIASGRGGSIEWPVSSMDEADYTFVAGLVDYVKSNNDEPIIFYPNASRANEAIFGRIDSDQISLQSQAHFHESAGIERYFGATLPIYPVLR